MKDFGTVCDPVLPTKFSGVNVYDRIISPKSHTVPSKPMVTVDVIFATGMHEVLQSADMNGYGLVKKNAKYDCLKDRKHIVYVPNL